MNEQVKKQRCNQNKRTFNMKLSFVRRCAQYFIIYYNRVNTDKRHRALNVVLILLLLAVFGCSENARAALRLLAIAPRYYIHLDSLLLALSLSLFFSFI